MGMTKKAKKAKKKKKKNMDLSSHESHDLGIPTVAQQDQLCLWFAGTQVQSPAQHRLRIQLSYGIGCNCGSDLIHGLGTPYTTGQPKRKERSKRECNKKTKKN